MKNNEPPLPIYRKDRMRETVAFPKSHKCTEGQRGTDPCAPTEPAECFLRLKRAPLEDVICRLEHPVSV